MQKLKIISRNSKLAMWQAEFVRGKLIDLYPHLSVDIIGITTEGDRILDKSLDKIGGKGLFIKELEFQLVAGTADIAVHSLKDLPANLIGNFSLAAVLERENPFDALISNKYKNIDDLPDGSIIGTSSARRVAILRKYYPNLKIKLLRGNLQTRLNKLDNDEYDAIILAVAGLKRLGLESRIVQILPDNYFLPAIGQGALAIEIYGDRDDLVQLLEPLNDYSSYRAVMAEREMGKYLNASCNIPIAGFAEVRGQTLELRAMLADIDDANYLTSSVVGCVEDYLELGQRCAKNLLNQGADIIVKKYSVV